MDHHSHFVSHVAQRLCAAWKSAYVAQSFSEILSDLHTNGWQSEGERATWEAIAELVVPRKDEIARGFEDYLDSQRLVQ